MTGAIFVSDRNEHLKDLFSGDWMSCEPHRFWRRY